MHSLVFYSWKICKCIDSISLVTLSNVITYVRVLIMTQFSVFRNLGNNIFPNLPKKGLNRILHLKTFNNPNLREFPAPETFPRIQVCTIFHSLLSSYIRAPNSLSAQCSVLSHPDASQLHSIRISHCAHSESFKTFK